MYFKEKYEKQKKSPAEAELSKSSCSVLFLNYH